MSTNEFGVELPGDSRHKQWFWPAIIAAIMAVSVAAGIALTNHEATRQASAASAPAAQVILTADGLDSAELQVRKGQSVVWEVRDGAEHQLALSGGSAAEPGFGSPVRFGPDQSYSYVFDAPGTFYYYDTLDPLRFKGVVVVSE